MGLEGQAWGRREPWQRSTDAPRDGAGPRRRDGTEGSDRDGAGPAKSQPHPGSPLLGRSCAPGAALGTLGRSQPESPQQPSEAHFRDGNGEAGGGGGGERQRPSARPSRTQGVAGGRGGRRRRGRARAPAAGTWAPAARSSCWRGRPGSPCSSPSPSGS